jgi:hypothetical protein
VAFSPDGCSVISGSEDGTALVWDISDLKSERASDGPLDPDSLRVHWKALAGDDARAAYRATWARSVTSAVGFLRDHLRPASAVEPITSPEILRTVRALTALDRVHTPEARGVIERLTQGVSDAVTTREAKATLERLNRAMGRLLTPPPSSLPWYEVERTVAALRGAEKRPRSVGFGVLDMGADSWVWTPMISQQVVQRNPGAEEEELLTSTGIPGVPANYAECSGDWV